MMDRRRFLLTSLAGALATPLAAEAQNAGKVYRIGVLDLTPDLARMEAFCDGLSKLGYVEGQDIAILDRLAEGKVHRLPELAAELVRLKVDVIVTGGATTTYAAQQATRTIPIVMAGRRREVADGSVVATKRGNACGAKGPCWLHASDNMGGRGAEINGVYRSARPEAEALRRGEGRTSAGRGGVARRAKVLPGGRSHNP
jgi:ABC transporter substrate binding protein